MLTDGVKVDLGAVPHVGLPAVHRILFGEFQHLLVSIRLCEDGGGHDGWDLAITLDEGADRTDSIESNRIDGAIHNDFRIWTLELGDSRLD